ncbi:hypothetical protein WOLCODRAFT_17763 [Wolfiporia cocos MD-104 SS10]|uniref:Uncharacterized protein n=1 Tax=Wolfiporia cocos (strain MD-104) TaxID=742152 RepID=A0A2H3JJW9_WOLCO|nr:hypothetical protein WOLCODRAFT_17763 [Wolfiporia cocos MD-104 SS10]
MIGWSAQWLGPWDIHPHQMHILAIVSIDYSQDSVPPIVKVKTLLAADQEPAMYFRMALRATIAVVIQGDESPKPSGLKTKCVHKTVYQVIVRTTHRQPLSCRPEGQAVGTIVVINRRALASPALPQFSAHTGIQAHKRVKTPATGKRLVTGANSFITTWVMLQSVKQRVEDGSATVERWVISNVRTVSSWIDVRDLAEAHALALKIEEAGDGRIIVSAVNDAQAHGADVLAYNGSYNHAEATYLMRYDASTAAKLLGLKYRSMQRQSKICSRTSDRDAGFEVVQCFQGQKYGCIDPITPCFGVGKAVNLAV